MSDDPDLSTSNDGDDLPVLDYVPSPHPEALWDRDLTPDRTGWRPHSGEELWRRVLPWKCEQMTARVGGELVRVLELTNGGEPSWDWRTVSF